MSFTNLKDDFTLEIKKYFIEITLGHVEKYIVLLSKENFSPQSDWGNDFFKLTIKDAGTNELNELAQFFEKGFEFYNQRNCKMLLQFFKVAQIFLMDLYKKPTCEPGACEKYFCKIQTKSQNLFFSAKMGELKVLINATSILEIVPMETLHELPFVSISTLGLICFRGEMVPVLRPNFWSLPEVSKDEIKYFIIFKSHEEIKALPFVTTDRLLDLNIPIPPIVKNKPWIHEVTLLDTEPTIILNLNEMEKVA